MNLSDIQPGMEIEYINCPDKRKSPKARTGTVRQVTSRMIAVQGQRYPDTILVNDLLTGQAQILNLRGEGEMAKVAPAKEVLQEVFDRKGTLSRVAQELRVSMPTAKKWLMEAGILPNIPPPLVMTPGEELPRTRVPYTLSEYNKAVVGQPVPAPSDTPAIGRVKVQLIAAILAEYKDGIVDYDDALQLTRGILDMGVA